MATEINLSEQEIADLKELTNQSDVTAALRTAMTEYIRYARRMRLKELSGRMEMQENQPNLTCFDGE
jgi:hypothetical protein